MGLFSKKSKGDEVVLKIEGMTCNHCVMRVTKALNDLDGVHEANVSLEENQAKVVYNDKKVSIDDMKVSVEDAGYKVVER